MSAAREQSSHSTLTPLPRTHSHIDTCTHTTHTNQSLIGEGQTRGQIMRVLHMTDVQLCGTAGAISKQYCFTSALSAHINKRIKGRVPN